MASTKQRKQITINIDYRDELPDAVYGVSLPQEKGTYTIVINDNMKPVEQFASFLHEITHIYRGDHEKTGADVNQLEAETRQMLLDALETLRSR